MTKPAVNVTNSRVIASGTPVANSILAVEPGVIGVDTSLAEHDAGAGSCAIEVFNAAANLLGWKYRRGLFAIQLRNRRTRYPRTSQRRLIAGWKT